MIRLGKDQECYDFIKWWTVASDDSHYDWSDTRLPHMDLRGEDAFEDVERFCDKYAELDHVVAVTLLKIRMLLDLQSLQAVARETDGKVPNEITSSIKSHVVTSNIIGGNREILDAPDHSARIKTLVSQVRALVLHVIKLNPYIWHMLLDREEVDSPASFSRGFPEQAQIAIHYSFNAWLETDGAVDVVEELMEWAYDTFKEVLL